MYKDPVIEEIRDRRKKLVREKYHGSIEEFLDAAKEYQKKHHEKVVNLHEDKKLKKAS
jgi:hypothetical protein